MASSGLSGPRRMCLVCHQEFDWDTARCPNDSSALVPISDTWIGQVLCQRYKILERIGAGGMSNVYRAEHLVMRRQVAVKMLRANLLSDEQTVRRFQQEARAIGALNHPNVVTIYEVDVSPRGEPYMVMECIEGQSLRSIVRHQWPLTLPAALHILSQAASALAHAHNNGVLHRDVKPSNIMVLSTEKDRYFAKILDFGLAKLRSLTGELPKLTRTGEVFGSPPYMSPEQCTGKKADVRSDIYSFGCVMYELLAGKPPFAGKNAIEVIRQHLKEQPPQLSACGLIFPPQADEILSRLLQKSPDNRYQSMQEVQQDLESMLQSILSVGVVSAGDTCEMEALLCDRALFSTTVVTATRPQQVHDGEQSSGSLANRKDRQDGSAGVPTDHLSGSSARGESAGGMDTCKTGSAVAGMDCRENSSFNAGNMSAPPPDEEPANVSAVPITTGRVAIFLLVFLALMAAIVFVSLNGRINGGGSGTIGIDPAKVS